MTEREFFTNKIVNYIQKELTLSDEDLIVLKSRLDNESCHVLALILHDIKNDVKETFEVLRYGYKIRK